MAHEDTERDRAVRAMLVDRVQARQAAPGMRLQPERFRVGIVTAVVLVAIVALSVAAVRFGADRGAPAQGGLPATPLPTASVSAGKLLGRFTSDDGPVQTHTIHPDGLAIRSVFRCEGVGDYRVSIQHDSEFASVTPAGQTPGPCDGGTGSGGGSHEKGIAGSSKVSITTVRGMRWTLTIVGVPETYITPQPVVDPTTPAGTSVPFCSASDLSGRYEAVKGPVEVTETGLGQIVLTNTTARACALAGYPTVLFVGGDGEVLGHHTMEATDERSSTEDGLDPVILAPEGKAWTQVGYYLPNYYPANEQGVCQKQTVHAMRIDLANRLAGDAQQGTIDVPTGAITACRNGPWGTDGSYGQLSSTVFVDYALPRK